MRYLIQIISNNILQQIPTIILTYSQRTINQRYIFNIPQQFIRFAPLHNLQLSRNINIYFTKYNIQTISGLSSFMLNLIQRRSQSFKSQNKGYNTKIYFDHKNYQYWSRVKKYMGWRFFKYSFFNLRTGACILGLRNQAQATQLQNFNKMRFLRGDFNNQELLELIKQPSDAAQYMKLISQSTNQAQNSNSINYAHESPTSQLKIFTTPNPQHPQQPYYNYIFTTQKIRGSVNQQKLSQLTTKHNLQRNQQLQLIKYNQLVLNNGQTILSSQIYYKNNNNMVIILHYRDKGNIQEIRNNKIFMQCMDKINKQNAKVNTVVHIIQGDGKLVYTKQFVQFKKIFGDTCKNIVYNRNLLVKNRLEQLKKQLLYTYPHYLLCKDMHILTDGYVADICQKVLKIYQKFNMKNIVQHTPSQQQLDINKDIVLFKPQQQLHIFPISFKSMIQNVKNTYSYNLPNKNLNPSNQNSHHMQKLIKTLKILTYKMDPKVIFLGTGSMTSTLYRNVSGIVIKYDCKQNKNQQWSMVMDCGQGIYNQFFNHFGSVYQQQLIKIRILFITHMHQDHISGILNFISKRNKALNNKYKTTKQLIQNKNKLFLILPRNTVSWYQQFNTHIQNIGQFCHIIYSQNLQSNKVQKAKNKFTKSGVFKKNDTEMNKVIDQQINEQKKQRQSITLADCLQSQQFFIQLTQQQKNTQKYKQQQRQRQNLISKYTKTQQYCTDQLKNFLRLNNVQQFLAVPTYHCNQSYGLIITLKNQIKISYSGDCRPTSQFKYLAKNSTLMIHQATFKAIQKQKAKNFLHSTTAQAMQIGYKSNSIMTALTHFNVQFGTKNYGNQNLRNLQANVQDNYKKYNVFKAVDHLQFRISQMYKLPFLMDKVSYIG